MEVEPTVIIHKIWTWRAGRITMRDGRIKIRDGRIKIRDGRIKKEKLTSWFSKRAFKRTIFDKYIYI
jgi:hypothetical protein